jgi:hypothetical protein
MPPSRNNDYSDLAALMQGIVNPLASKLQVIDDKVNSLSQDRVTRSDIEKLRAELIGTMVPRDAYEPRHLALVERQTTLEAAIREARKEHIDEVKAIRDDMEQDLQRVHERLESGKAQIEQRIKDQQDVTLSDKDRLWIRWNQVVGFVGIAIALIELIMQHVKFN